MNLIQWATHQRAVKGSAHHLLLLLAAHADRYGDVAISHRELALVAGYNSLTVARHLAALEEAGYLLTVIPPHSRYPATRRIISGECWRTLVDPRLSSRQRQQPSRRRKDPLRDSVPDRRSCRAPRNLDEIDERLLTALLRQAKRGDESAIERIAALANDLLAEIAWNHLGNDSELDDRLQEGRIALMKAIDKFDLDRGKKFGAFLRSVASTAMVDSLEVERMVKVPRKRIKQIKAATEARDQLHAELGGQEPTADEIAARAAILPARQRAIISPGQVSDLLAGIPMVDQSEILEDTSADPETAQFDTLLASEPAAQIQDLLDQLPAEQRAVLELKFGFGGKALSDPQIATQLGQKVSWVKSTYTEAITALRSRANLELLDELQEDI